jgi:hypothetical protein
MSRLRDNLEYEIGWRVGEIATIKKLIKSDKLNPSELEVIQKYSIASIYSLWQGFVVRSFECYIEEINNSNLKAEEISLNILTHTMDTLLQFEKGRTEFAKKCNFVNKLFEYLTNDAFVITKAVPNKGNINFKELNDIFECFNFSKRLDKKYASDLNFFLKVRHDIAHGEFSILIDENMIYKFCSLVTDLMSEVALIIFYEYQHKNYLKHRPL